MTEILTCSRTAEQRFSLVIVPKGETFSKLIELSQHICQRKQAEYKLGEISLPHMTLVQFKGTLAQAQEAWKKAANIPVNFEVKLREFYISNVLENGKCYSGFRVERNKKMQICHNQLLECVPKNMVNGAVEDSYFPHVTTALLEQKDYNNLDVTKLTSAINMEE